MFSIKRAIAKAGLALGWPSRYDLGLPLETIKYILTVNDVPEHNWFITSIRNRRLRDANNTAMDWIVENVGRDQLIFEVGCGCGANLIWLAQHGYSNLTGSDRDPAAINAARQLADLAQADIRFETCDGFIPEYNGVDALLAVDCIYYAPFDMIEYLIACRERLAPHGHLVFDMVDSSFNAMKNNQYHTDLWHLPEAKRPPSQYVVRLSPRELIEKSFGTGLKLVEQLPGTRIPPRYVAVLSKGR